jgi:hypothetical protein
MRINPLLCWECESWFVPKTLHRTKFCCNACKQQFHLKESNSDGFKRATLFYTTDDNAMKEILDCCGSNCNCGNGQRCAECLFTNNFNRYKELVKEYGKDSDGRTMDEWLMFRKITS